MRQLFCLRQNELGFCHSEMSFHNRVRIVVETAESSVGWAKWLGHVSPLLLPP